MAQHNIEWNIVELPSENVIIKGFMSWLNAVTDHV
jgi:hypothetical protein